MKWLRCYAVLLCLVGCSNLASSVEPKVAFRPSISDLVDSSSLIVVATVRTGKVLETVPTQALENGKLDAVQLQLDVERVVKGSTGNSHLDVLWFAYRSGVLPENAPLDFIHQGERRIFFITEKQNKLRTVADFNASSILVETGSARGYSSQSAGPAPITEICEILLLPRGAVDLERYVKATQIYLNGFLREVVPSGVLSATLRVLVKSPDALVSDHGCVELAVLGEQMSCFESGRKRFESHPLFRDRVKLADRPVIQR